jgi:hypothetical protein
MAKLVLIKAAAGALHGSFRRLGRTFKTTGSIVDQAEFSKEDWDILVAEKMLHIGPAPEGASGEVDDTALREAVKEAIAKLQAEDFGDDGLPKVDALRKVLPAKTKGVTATLVAEVWTTLKPPAA